MDGTMTPADISAVMGRNNGGMFEGNGAWWIIILFLFAFCGGWGGNGFGGASGASENYVLASDFATIQRQLSDGFSGVEKGLDTVRNGLCDGFYTEAQLVNGVNMNIAQGNYNTLNAITQNGYESRLATQNLSSQLASCCCDNEKSSMQTRFDMAQYNCNTLQAIDKVGDRIIDYLANEKTQALRDENQALRLSASQSAQNNYLINALRPTPIPAFPASNLYGYCNCGCSQNI